MALFALFYYLVRLELTRGERVFLGSVRGLVDRGIDGIAAAVGRAMARPTAARHRTRPTDNNPTIATLMRHATRTPLTVTHTDNHLSKMREHKVETALTTAQKNKRKKQKLEERF